MLFEPLDEPASVYNFEVDDFHTYFAGENSVLVHNRCKPTSINQMQKQVERNQAPRDVVRVDKPHVFGQKPHIHFSDGTSLNIDGTIHDKRNGIPNLTRETAEWLENNGW